jgi:hypothetical protein
MFKGLGDKLKNAFTQDDGTGNPASQTTANAGSASSTPAASPMTVQATMPSTPPVTAPSVLTVTPVAPTVDPQLVAKLKGAIKGRGQKFNTFLAMLDSVRPFLQNNEPALYQAAIQTSLKAGVDYKDVMDGIDDKIKALGEEGNAAKQALAEISQNVENKKAEAANLSQRRAAIEEQIKQLHAQVNDLGQQEVAKLQEAETDRQHYSQLQQQMQSALNSVMTELQVEKQNITSYLTKGG